MKELELIAYCLSLMSEEDYNLMLAFMAGATFKRLETANKYGGNGMEKPMKASVVPATEQAQRSVYEALAMMIVEFYKRNPEFVEHPERMAEHEPES